MAQPTPAQPGIALDDVDTPALVLDLDAYERLEDRLTGGAAAVDVELIALHRDWHDWQTAIRSRLAPTLPQPGGFEGFASIGEPFAAQPLSRCGTCRSSRS